MQTNRQRNFPVLALLAACVLIPSGAFGSSQAPTTIDDQLYLDSVPSGATVVNLPRRDGQGKDVELGKTPMIVNLTTVQSMRFAVMMGVDEYLKQVKPFPELSDFAAQFESRAQIVDISNRLVQQYFDFGTGVFRSTSSSKGTLTSFGTVYDLTVSKAPRLCTLFIPLGADRKAFFPLMPEPGTFRTPPMWLERLKSTYQLSDEDANTAGEYLSRAGAYVISLKDPIRHISITVAPDGAIQEVTRGNPSAAGEQKAPVTPAAPRIPRPADLAATIPRSHYPPEVRSRARSEYDAILRRIQNGDTTVDFREFRLDATLMSNRSSLQAQVWESEDRVTFKRLLDAGSTEAALDSANRSLERNYSSIYGHMNAMVACRKLNRAAEAAMHQKIAIALLDSIQTSGDGRSPETAWFVTTIPEEYALLSYRLHVTRKRQGIARQGDHSYDWLEVVDASDRTQTVWFNTDVDLGQYKSVLRPPESLSMPRN